MTGEPTHPRPRTRRHGLSVSVSGTGLLLLGLGCLAWGAYVAGWTYHFVEGAARATGTVFYGDGAESNTLLVEVRARNGRVMRTLPVRIAWWTPPWRYNRGETVTVLYDPHGDYDAPFFSDRARVDAWGQLWGASVLWGAAGLACIVLWMLVRGFPRRVSAAVRLGVETDRPDV